MIFQLWPRSLFDAIRQVETGGEADPRMAEGDGGRAIGPYQISHSYWYDAIRAHPEISGTYEDVREAHYAELIMLAYWDRYAPDDTYETLSRIHNGGPLGHLRDATQDYWRKVQAWLP